MPTFREKPDGDGAWINGGFFVCEPDVIDYIDGDATIWEREPLERLADEGQLSVYRHDGFWQPMDTLRDKHQLESVERQRALEGLDGLMGKRPRHRCRRLHRPVLTPKLLADGHEVVGVDTGFYRAGWLYNAGGAQWPPTHAIDIRHIGPEHLEGFDAVVHLAELSNDPLGQLTPGLTHRDQPRGQRAARRAGKAAGVERFVYTSSCSVYGAGGDHMRTEESETDPQTAYAECKTLVERDLKPMADDDFSPTFLRNATAYGPSPRMRFDIVLNNLSGFAWTTGEINMTSDGSPWRPIVHVDDICDAVRAALDRAPRGRARRGLQRRPQRRQLPGARDRRDRRRRLPGLPALDRQLRRRQPQLPGELRQDHRQPARVQGHPRRRARRPAAAHRLRAHRAHPGALRVRGASPG